MLGELSALVRPQAGFGAGGTSTASASAVPAEASAGSIAPAPASGSGNSSFGGSPQGSNHSAGAYVPPLSSADAGSAASPAMDAYAENGAETGRWMSASVPQPDAPSFADAARALQHGPAAIPDDRRASLDYLLSSLKRAQQSGHAAEPQPTPALRHAAAAYGEF